MQSLGTSTLSSAAELIERRMPQDAARLYLEWATRLLRSGDARRYAQTQRALERAQGALKNGGQLNDWEQTIDRLRKQFEIVQQWYPQDA